MGRIYERQGVAVMNSSLFRETDEKSESFRKSVVPAFFRELPEYKDVENKASVSKNVPTFTGLSETEKAKIAEKICDRESDLKFHTGQLDKTLAEVDKRNHIRAVKQLSDQIGDLKDQLKYG